MAQTNTVKSSSEGFLMEGQLRGCDQYYYTFFIYGSIRSMGVLSNEPVSSPQARHSTAVQTPTHPGKQTERIYVSMEYQFGIMISVNLSILILIFRSITNVIFKIQDKKKEIQGWAYILKRMLAQNITLSEELVATVEGILKQSTSTLSQLVEKGLNISVFIGGAAVASYTLNSIGDRIIWNFIETSAKSRKIWTIFSSKMPLMARVCSNGWFQLTGGIFVGLLVEQIFGILLAVYREGKLDEQIKELREAAEEQFQWLSNIVDQKIRTPQEFFEHHRKIWKGQSKLDLAVKLIS